MLVNVNTLCDFMIFEVMIVKSVVMVILTNVFFTFIQHLQYKTRIFINAINNKLKKEKLDLKVQENEYKT